VKFAKVCIRSRTKTIFAGKLFGNKGLCNNYLEWGGGIGENHNSREGLDVKLNKYRGEALLFSLFFTNWKSGRRAIRV